MTPPGRAAIGMARVQILASALVGAVLLALVAVAVWALNDTPGRRASVPATQSVTVLAVGDIACEPGLETTTTACRHEEVGDLIADAKPHRFIALGDLQYQEARIEDFLGDGAYDDTFGDLQPITMPVLGNHEHLDGTDGYFDYFYGQDNDSGDFGERPIGYYTSTLGAWNFIALDSDCDENGVIGGCGKDGPQYRWLEQRLEESTAACTLVAMHHPRWSTGAKHGSTPELADLWDLMADHGVDVAIAGHNHSSEVFEPIGRSGSGSSPELSPTGIRSFVAGAGGANFQGLTEDSDSLVDATVARDSSAFGPLELTLGEGTYSWRFLPIDGMEFESDGTDGSFSGDDSCR